MRFITKKHLSRRTLLRGLGATMSLPLLDSMMPAQTPLAKTAANPEISLGLCFIPHGAVMANWTPAAEGANFKLSRTLAPVEPFKDQVVVVTNLAHKMAAPGGPGDNGGDHTRSPAVFLNGVHPKRTDGADIQAGVTIDQMAAQKIGQETPLPSLELATEDFSGLVGSCDVGFSCAYMNTISWRTPTTPLPDGNQSRAWSSTVCSATAPTPRNAWSASKNSAAFWTRSSGRCGIWKADLGANDRNRVSEYLDTVREIERRIQLAEKQNAQLRPCRARLSHRHSGRSRGTFQADVRSDDAGVSGRHHAHLHVHDGSRSELSDLPDARHFGRFSPRFASSEQSRAPGESDQDQHLSCGTRWLTSSESLKATPDGDGNLLDHSLILYGSGMSNSNVHNHSPLPVLVAGGAAGKLKGGRHLKYPEDTPMANLLLTILDKAGVPQERVGDSTGMLTEV